MLSFKEQGHNTEKYDEVELAFKNVKNLGANNNNLLFWHLSSSFYKGRLLDIDDINNAISELKKTQFKAKYAVSDTDGFMDAAKKTSWFTSTDYPKTNLVFTWIGLKEHLR